MSHSTSYIKGCILGIKKKKRTARKEEEHKDWKNKNKKKHKIKSIKISRDNRSSKYTFEKYPRT